jgi:hypothetical protein
MIRIQVWARGNALTLGNWCAMHGLNSIAHWLYWQRWVGIFSREPLTDDDMARVNAIAEQIEREHSE